MAKAINYIVINTYTMWSNPKGRFSSPRKCIRQRLGGILFLLNSWVIIRLVSVAKQNYPLGKDFLPRQPTPNYMAGGFNSFSSLNCEAYHEFQNQQKMDE